jgi:hypothetical protein
MTSTAEKPPGPVIVPVKVRFTKFSAALPAVTDAKSALYKPAEPAAPPSPVVKVLKNSIAVVEPME